MGDTCAICIIVDGTDDDDEEQEVFLVGAVDDDAADDVYISLGDMNGGTAGCCCCCDMMMKKKQFTVLLGNGTILTVNRNENKIGATIKREQYKNQLQCYYRQYEVWQLLITCMYLYINYIQKVVAWVVL